MERFIVLVTALIAMNGWQDVILAALKGTVARLQQIGLELATPSVLLGYDRYTERLLRAGGVVIASFGNYVSGEIIALGQLNGTLTKGADTPLPGVTNLAIGRIKWGKKTFLVRTRLTFFNKKVEGRTGYELRIQSNATRKDRAVWIGDPIKTTLLMTDVASVMNLAMLSSEVESMYGWTIAVQASLTEFIRDDEHAQGAPRGKDRPGGARADRVNIVSGVEVQPWLYNNTAFRIWLLPPGNPWELEAFALESENTEGSPVVVGDDVRVSKVRTTKAAPGAPTTWVVDAAEDKIE